MKCGLALLWLSAVILLAGCASQQHGDSYRRSGVCEVLEDAPDGVLPRMNV